ncbi:MAG: NAD kinase [Flavobacteriales bacterium]|nr:NAD kinase [Flavobacteriales bacterium]
MKIAIYGKKVEDIHLPNLQRLFDSLQQKKIQVGVFDSFHGYLASKISFPKNQLRFSSFQDVPGFDFLFSIGGDGTLLDTAGIVRDSGVPVLGINTGRLGFLSHVDADDAGEALDALLNNSFSLDQRSLISVTGNQQQYGEFPYALNEVTVLNKERNSMITIHAYVNDEYMCTYWADGLIVATPTGSTAYSLSCGGPIVTPDSATLILTPIAPHNLNVRPFVISNKNKISLRTEGRDGHFLLSLDSRSFTIDSHTILELTLAPFQINLVNIEGQSFFNTIRNKLAWGLDKRN